MNRFKFAQAAPPQAAEAAPPPLPMPAPPMPMDPMGGMGLSMSGAPTMPMAGGQLPAAGSDVENRSEIIGPINSIAQIFYDSAVANFIQNNMQMTSDDIAEKIWSDYGGNQDGTANLSNVGKRTLENKKLSAEKAKAEREQTQNKKWERLEQGLNIQDIISYEDLGKLTQGLMYGVIMKAGAAAAAPPPGAMPAMASLIANKSRIIIAKQLEKEYFFKQSDTIINDIFKNI